MSFEGTLPSAADHTQSRRIHGSDDVTEPPWDLEVVDDDPSSIGKPWLSEANASRSPTAMLDRYLRWMTTSRATDLHLSPGFPASLRVDRVLRTGLMAAPTEAEVQVLIDNLLSGARRAEFEANHSVDVGYSLEGTGRFRISCFRHTNGPAISIRHIPEEVGDLDDLRLPQKLADLVDYPSGLVLFCGPTGSGKSTTQAALLRMINEGQARHVITLEDPIEYVHRSRKSLIHQREIGEHAPSFARGLTDALREDPDMILVGELRDRETISMALAAAETGHLVFATLHVNTTASAITRLQHAFNEFERPLARAQIAESLRAVVNQRLLPNANGPGLVPVVELLRVTHAVSSLIRDDKLHQIKQVLPTGQAEGMITFERSAAVAQLAGHISPEEARRVVPDRQALDNMLAMLRKSSSHSVASPKETGFHGRRSLRSVLGA